MTGGERGSGGAAPGAATDRPDQRTPSMDFKEFGTQVLSTCDRDPFDAAVLVFRVSPDDPTRLDVYLPLRPMNADGSAGIREGLKGRHDLLAMASKTTWAPEPGAERTPAWLVVIVGRRFDPLYLVKSIGAGNEWSRIPDRDIPEYARLTAKGLTGCLDGKPFGRFRIGRP